MMKVDVRLPEKGNSNSHGARPVHLIITMIKWIRTCRLLKKKSLSWQELVMKGSKLPPGISKRQYMAKAKNARAMAGYEPQFKNNYLAEM